MESERTWIKFLSDVFAVCLVYGAPVIGRRGLYWLRGGGGVGGWEGMLIYHYPPSQPWASLGQGFLTVLTVYNLLKILKQAISTARN